MKSFIQKSIKPKITSAIAGIKSFYIKWVKPKFMSGMASLKLFFQQWIKPKVNTVIDLVKSYVQKSIKVKVILSITLIIGVITLAGLIYFPQKFKSAEMEAMSDKINTISKIASFNVGFGMYFNDRDAVAEQLEPILNIPYITYIIVENQRDSVFYSSNFQRAAEQNYAQIEPDFISVDGSTYKIKTPVVFNYEQLGNIYIGYSLQVIYSEIDKIQGQIVYISLILFILGVVAAYFFADHILEPLLKIVKASKEITLGKLKTRAAVLTKDEIGKLAESFNEMVDKLDRAQEELEQRVKDRTRELEEALISLQIAKEKAERSDQLKTEFLAQMSHEIRTPINVFLNYASLVEMELKENEREELEEEYKVMESASRRLIRTIDLMLNFSEVQSNSYVCQNKEIDIYNDILVELVKEYTGSAKDKGLDLILNERETTEHINADVYTVTQIFRNLIENAIKYTEEGKVDIRIKTNKNNKLSVVVADTGIGISKEYMDGIFEPFTQEDQGNTRRYQGNGLALALVKKYCELNNADVDVESKKGKGSKFTVTFNR